MRTLIMTIAYLISFNIFGQKENLQYFLINENDTLIKKQVATKKNKYQGYEIVNENKIVKKHIRSSKIDDDDIEIDAFDSLSFTFNEDTDTIVDKIYIEKLNIIKTRKEFFEINAELDETKNRFIFIEPLKCGKFIIREVRPLIFE